MAILIDQERGTITLHTRNTTYQMKISSYGHLLHTYYGKRCQDDMSYLITGYDRGFSGNPYETGKDRSYSMDTLPQEYPCFGTGDFRNAALAVEWADGSCIVDLRYVSAEVRAGKYAITGLPAAYGAESDCDTLIVHLKDRDSSLCADLYYGVFAECDVITRAARIINQNSAPVWIQKAASLCLDFMNGAYDILHFHGRYGMERLAERAESIHGSTVLKSRRGISSHQENPFFIVAEKAASEDVGCCYGLNLLYSGNFQNEIEKDPYEQLRVLSGISEEQFSYELLSEEEFWTPEALLCFSSEGFQGLSDRLHPFVREHICRGAYQNERRPVLINNWEATYFQFHKDKLLQIAEQAAELGIELFVLDDGWFGKRDSDESGLGDWSVNEEKLGGTLEQLAEQMRSLGMKFGLWIEPEMVSEDSELYREHPDYAFIVPGRAPVRSRYQLVLDFSRQEVVDAIFGQLSAVLDKVKPDYLKIDMNRSICEVYSAVSNRQNYGTILYHYVRGMYQFLERLLLRYPDLLIEGCCGGGGRFDLGMLYYAPQIWCSDNTDAIERLKIQHGTSYGYPPSCIGAHVSIVPNHQTGRITPLRTRGAVAMSGAFGYELDLGLLTAGEKEQIRKQVADYKKDYALYQQGRYFRLTDPIREQTYAAWEYAEQHGKKAVLYVTMLAAACNPPAAYVRMKGLCAEKLYYIEETGQRCTGAALMYGGLPIPRFMEAEYDTWRIHITCIG